MRCDKNFKKIRVGLRVGRVGMCHDDKELSTVAKSACFLVAKSSNFSQNCKGYTVVLRLPVMAGGMKSLGIAGYFPVQLHRT